MNFIERSDFLYISIKYIYTYIVYVHAYVMEMMVIIMIINEVYYYVCIYCILLE